MVDLVVKPTRETIGVLYTGRRPPGDVPQSISLLHHPTIQTKMLPDILDSPDIATLLDTIRLGVQVWIVLYSSTSARLLTRLHEQWQTNNLSPLDRCVIVAVGKQTAKHLRNVSPQADIRTPEDQRFLGVLSDLHQLNQRQALPPIIYSLELQGTDRVLAEQFTYSDGVIVSLPCYHSTYVVHPDLPRRCLDHHIRWVILTSPKGARGFFESMNHVISDICVAAIGPTTARAIEQMGYVVDYTAPKPNVESIIQHIASIGTTV